MVASMNVCTLWCQQAITVKEPVEQRDSHALWSHVTPAANKTLADLGLRGASTNALLLRGTFELSRLSNGINLTQWSWAERDLQEI